LDPAAIFYTFREPSREQGESMADKLPYQNAIVQICALLGWTDQAGRQPEIRRENGTLVVISGPGFGIRLETTDRDIESSWDPMDGDKQQRARDALMAALKRMGLRDGMTCRIGPPMWKVS